MEINTKMFSVDIISDKIVRNYYLKRGIYDIYDIIHLYVLKVAASFCKWTELKILTILPQQLKEYVDK